MQRLRLTDSRFASDAVNGNADALPSAVARKKQCAGLVDAGAENATLGGGLIRIWVSGAARPSATLNTGSAIDFSKCLRGICYRPYTSITVTLTVRGAFEKSGAFLMPDPNVLAFINLSQGVFATQKYTIEFGDGVPTQLDQDSKSEFLGFAKLPVDLLTVILSAPGEALGLKKKALQDEDAYLDVVKESVAKREEVAGICAKSKALCPSTAYRILGGAVNPSTDSDQSERANDGSDDDQTPQLGEGSTDDVPAEEVVR